MKRGRSEVNSWKIFSICIGLSASNMCSCVAFVRQFSMENSKAKWNSRKHFKMRQHYHSHAYSVSSPFLNPLVNELWIVWVLCVCVGYVVLLGCTTTRNSSDIFLCALFIDLSFIVCINFYILLASVNSNSGSSTAISLSPASSPHVSRCGDDDADDNDANKYADSFCVNVKRPGKKFNFFSSFFRFVHPQIAPHELTFLIISQKNAFSVKLANELKSSILNQVQIDAFLNSNEVPLYNSALYL